MYNFKYLKNFQRVIKKDGNYFGVKEWLVESKNHNGHTYEHYVPVEEYELHNYIQNLIKGGQLSAFAADELCKKIENYSDIIRELQDINSNMT